MTEGATPHSEAIWSHPMKTMMFAAVSVAGDFVATFTEQMMLAFTDPEGRLL